MSTNLPEQYAVLIGRNGEESPPLDFELWARGVEVVLDAATAYKYVKSAVKVGLKLEGGERKDYDILGHTYEGDTVVTEFTAVRSGQYVLTIRT